MSDQARLNAALSLSQHGAPTIKDVKNVLGPLEGAQETREKLDHTLRAYANLERSCAEKGRRIAQLEAALREIDDIEQQRWGPGNTVSRLVAKTLALKGKSFETSD